MINSLSIIIPTHQRHSSLVRLLNSIQRQQVDFSFIEVFVITNFEDPRLVKEIKKEHYPFPLSLSSAERRGSNAARNKGIELASYDYLLFLDDDVELVDENYLSFILHFSWGDKLSAIGGGYLLPAHSSLIDQVYHEIAMEWVGKQSFSQQALLGGNTIYHRGLLRERLRFSEDIVFGGAETELNQRLLAAGYQMKFYQELSVLHHSSLSLLSFVKKAYLQGRGKMKTKDRTHTPLTLKDQSLRANILLSIYQDFFYWGNMVEEGKIRDIIVFILQWRVLFTLTSLTFIGMSLFFPIPLVGLSVVYLNLWDKCFKKEDS